MKTLQLFFLTLLTSSVAFAQPANDDPCGAIALTPDGSIGTYSNVDATVAAGEAAITPVCEAGVVDWCTGEAGTDNSLEGTVWFTFTSINTSATISTCSDASFDTQVAVFSATDCTDFSTLSIVGGNDDGAGCPNFSSLAEVSGLNVDETYWIMVDGWQGDTGDFEISVSQNDPSAARVQVIHNSPDDAAAVVDVYLDGEILFDDVAFRTASPFVDAPAGVEISVAIAPGTSTSVADAIATFPFTLAEGEKYIIVADGITGLSSTVYTPAPAFNLEVFPMAREEATDPANTDVLVHHGSTDAPTVDVVEVGVGAGIVVDDASYPQFAGYLELPTTTYQLAVQTADNATTVATYLAPLVGLEGQAITVVASGFLAPENNGDGPGFGLWVALADGGALIELPQVAENDNPCDAIDLPTDGTVIAGTNFGATVADGEDVVTPPDGSNGCASDDGWCTGQSVIDASVWFTFTAINTSATISTCYEESFDTQIAVYSATDCTDFGTLTLLGANDDGAGCPGFSSLLEVSGLTIGQTYWVLVDGYNGAQGDFGISILQPDPNAARVQVIHNSPDDAATVVDVYLDGEILFDDVAFRTASPFVDAPAGVEFTVAIAPGSSTSVADAIATFPFTLAAGEKYIIVADGITGLSSTVYNPAPAFNLEVFDMAREEATDPANTDVLVHHGSTDAPTVDVAEVGVGAGIVVDDASYPQFAGYLELPTTTYQLAVQTADNAVTVATYLAPLEGLEGEAITVLASGFLTPANNGDGPAFGLWVALADGGALIELPLVPGNDNPCDAIELPTDGTVVTATNVGATVLDGETAIAPPQTGCATQDGWCGAESGIDGSVWFTFTATGTEATITTCLDANTIDTQIAAYSATDCTDFGTLALLGANDDAIDGCALGGSGFASVLTLTGLTIGQTYWILVDGYNGAAGDFAISVTQTVGLDEEAQVDFGMFPNPADETLWITSSENLESISIIDMQGRHVISQAGMFRQVDISSLASGMYQVAVSTGDRVSYQKLIKE
jgi:hypothetical protein